jgi:hypothetical protein
MDSKETD